MPTVKDVAEAAGVSTATVSRALASPDKVSERTRDKVAKAIAAVGYAPNAAARNLRRSESRTIVAILPDIANPFFSQIISGMEEVAQRNGYQVLLGDAGHNAMRAKAYFDLVPCNQADGVILLTSEIPAELVASIQRGPDFPLVLACEYIDGLNSPSVRVDNQQAAAHATRYLLSLGHCRLATITGPMLNPISRERLLGFQQALQEQGIGLSEHCQAEGDFTFDSGYEQGKMLLAAPEQRPTAVFCHNDEMAIGVLKAAKDLGIKVPEQLSVVGFDNIDFSEYCEPELTTIHQPRADLGRTAMTLLLDMLQQKKRGNEHILKTQLIVRGSTAKPPN